MNRFSDTVETRLRVIFDGVRWRATGLRRYTTILIIFNVRTFSTHALLPCCSLSATSPLLPDNANCCSAASPQAQEQNGLGLPAVFPANVKNGRSFRIPATHGFVVSLWLRINRDGVNGWAEVLIIVRCGQGSNNSSSTGKDESGSKLACRRPVYLVPHSLF